MDVDINQESFEGVKTSKVGSLMKLGFGGYRWLFVVYVYHSIWEHDYAQCDRRKNQSDY